MVLRASLPVAECLHQRSLRSFCQVIRRESADNANRRPHLLDVFGAAVAHGEVSVERTPVTFAECPLEVLGHQLDERDLRAFEAHLAACDGCTEYLEQMRTTIRVVGTLTPNDLTQAAETALMQAFRDWKRSFS